MSQWRSGFPSFPDNAGHIWKEWALRIFLITGFIITEDARPFWREIQQEEVWLYKFPHTVGYVTTPMLYAFAVTSSIGILLLFLLLNRSIREAYEALLVPSLAIPVCGLLTNLIKISVGRPRPDYYARCLPGVVNIDAKALCTGPMNKVLEGRKSFPSGHSSIAFCTMGWISLYVAGKLCTFNKRGRGKSWRLLFTTLPLVCALLIAISRTSDYHHHWQDVTVGSILGFLIAVVVYRQYYPAPNSPYSPVPYAMLPENYETTDPLTTTVTVQQANRLAESFLLPDLDEETD